MPPTFLYAMCLAAYLVAMVLALVVAAVLLVIPSQRRTGVRLGLAVICSLAGILLFQFVVGIPIGLLLATVLACYELFHPPDSIRWTVGIPTILAIFALFTAASLAGCYTGASLGWQLGGGTPVRVAVSQQKISRWIFTRLRRRKA